MKLLLLRVLLQRHNRDEGYVLPVVVAIGLIMVLLGAVNILSAGEENLNALSDSQKSKALAIAEVGVARYRQFLDRNRMLTVYDSDDWSSISNTCDISSDIAEEADITNWKPVNDGGIEPIGEYRIVSYVYDIDNNLSTDNNGQFAPNDDNLNIEDLITFNGVDNNGDGVIDDPDLEYNPRGILTIQSKAADGSEARVEVEIPIRINQDDMTNLSPALWIGNSNITKASIGNLILDGDRNPSTNGTASNDNGNGNIVISKPANGTNPGCNPSDTDNSDNNRIVYDPRPLPTIIPDPDSSSFSSSVNNFNGSIADDDRFGSFRGEGNQPEDMLLLGTKEATPDKHKIWKTDSKGFNYYIYKTSGDLDIDDNEKVATDGQSKVILYVDNADINLNGNASLQAGSKFSRGYKSVGLQVYVEGSQNININPGGGTVRIKGLIHAPDSTFNITSSGTVLIEGSIWVDDWNNTAGANVTIIPDNAGVGTDKAYQHYLGTDNRAARPITNAPTNWEIQEVKDN